jgi:DNA invertase Pin-like site-specific DNA recombinase
MGVETMKKAYVYLRVSSFGQVNGNGFDRQEEAARAFALKTGIEIVEVFKEQVSGCKDEEHRQVFQQMISEILRNGVRTIIVEGLDRLAREYRIQEQLLIYLASKSISLIDCRTGEDVTDAISSDPMKKAMIQMQGIFSELEKNLLVKKLRLARESKRKATGKCEGRIGWNDCPDRRDLIIETIKTLRRKPKGKKRMTFVKVAAEINKMAGDDKKYSTLTGTEWNGPMIQNFIQRYVIGPI